MTKLEAKDYAKASVGAGGHDLVEQLVDSLFEVGWDGTLLYVKEKFGGLRFYIGCGTDEVFEIIEDAEDKSITICEECGKPGSLRNDGWLVTRCDDCYKKLQGD